MRSEGEKSGSRDGGGDDAEDESSRARGEASAGLVHGSLMLRADANCAVADEATLGARPLGGDRVMVIAFAQTAAAAAQVTAAVDVVVYGSTPAGCAAAIAAARNNASVTLLSVTQHIGGMMSGGLSCVDAVSRSVVGGIAKEYMDHALAHYYPYEKISHPYCFDTAEPHVLRTTFDEMLSAAGVHVVLDTPLQGVESQRNQTISAVVAGGARYTASVFLDASYEGDLLAAANVTYTVGREANTAYGEPHAGRRPLQNPSCYAFPPVDQPVSPYNSSNGALLPLVTSHARDLAPEGSADAAVTAYNYRVCLTNASTGRVEIGRPPAYDPAQYELVRRLMRAAPPASIHQVLKLYAVANVSDGFKVDVNNVGPLSTDLTGGSWAYPEASPLERGAIAATHERYIRGLLWFLRSDDSVPAAVRRQMESYAWCADEFASSGHFPPQLYVREARRMVGAVVMTETSVAAELGDASIAMGSYSFDCHPTQVVAIDEGQGGATTTIEGCIGAGPKRPYQVPFGAITPRRAECTNLLVPVALSASHVAFSSVRIELTWMAVGHSAGVAASMAAATRGSHSHNASAAVQDVNLAELHARLVAEGQVLSLGRAS